jgi:sulfatase-modifying factor enzyme 1
MFYLAVLRSNIPIIGNLKPEMICNSRIIILYLNLFVGVIASCLFLFAPTAQAFCLWDKEPEVPAWCSGEAVSAANFDQYKSGYRYFTVSITDPDAQKARKAAVKDVKSQALNWINGTLISEDCQYGISGEGSGTEGMQLQASMKCLSGHSSKGTVFGSIEKMVKPTCDDTFRACALMAVDVEEQKRMNTQRKQLLKCTGIFSEAYDGITGTKNSLKKEYINFADVVTALQDLKALGQETAPCKNLKLAEGGKFRPSDIGKLERYIINNIQIVNQGPDIIDMARIVTMPDPHIDIKIQVNFTNLRYKRPLSEFPLAVIDDLNVSGSFLPNRVSSGSDGSYTLKINERETTFISYRNSAKIVNLTISPHKLIRNSLSNEAQNLLFGKYYKTTIKIRPANVQCSKLWSSIKASNRVEDFERFLSFCKNNQEISPRDISSARWRLERLYHKRERAGWEKKAIAIDALKHDAIRIGTIVSDLEVFRNELQHTGLKQLAANKLRQLRKLRSYGHNDSGYWNQIHFANLPPDQKIAEYGDYLANYSEGNYRKQAAENIKRLAGSIPIAGLEGTGAKLVWVPSGQFSLEGVTYDIPVGFLMAEHETTVKEFNHYLESSQKREMKVAPCQPRQYSNWIDEDKKSEHPVNCVTYQNAVDFIEWLNGKSGAAQYRLCTDREWEYAATRYDKRWPKKSNLALYAKVRYSHRRQRVKSTVPANLDCACDKKSGLFNMFGNVSEWVEISDREKAGPYCTLKTAGGSFLDPAGEIYPGNQAFCLYEDERRATNGFRFCRSVY